MIERNLFSFNKKFEPGEIVCVCYYKSYEQIVAAIKAGNLKNVFEVGNAIKAGTNCGRCQNKIQVVLDEILNQTE